MMRYKVLSSEFGWLTSADTLDDAKKKADAIKATSSADGKVSVWENPGPEQKMVYESNVKSNRE